MCVRAGGEGFFIRTDKHTTAGTHTLDVRLRFRRHLHSDDGEVTATCGCRAELFVKLRTLDSVPAMLAQGHSAAEEYSESP